MIIFNKLLQYLTIASVGIFAGAMLTEGLVLIPAWRSLSPAEFFSWYGANDERLLDFFGPLTSVAAICTLANAALSFWNGHPGRWFALVATVLMLVAVSTFFLYFKSANASFSAASIPIEAVAGELSRWAKWHWWRTGFSLGALAATLLSASPGK